MAVLPVKRERCNPLISFECCGPKPDFAQAMSWQGENEQKVLGPGDKQHYKNKIWWESVILQASRYSIIYKGHIARGYLWITSKGQINLIILINLIDLKIGD